VSADRNECYPSVPQSGWAPTGREVAARRAALDWRNDMIGEVGAQRAVAASRGTIGAPGKKEAKA
jgi:hypothetical protein